LTHPLHPPKRPIAVEARLRQSEVVEPATALDLGVPIDRIAEATFARGLSGHANVRTAAHGAPNRGIPT
jgi:hypothetical protein